MEENDRKSRVKEDNRIKQGGWKAASTLDYLTFHFQGSQLLPGFNILTSFLLPPLPTKGLKGNQAREGVDVREGAIKCPGFPRGICIPLKMLM
ncbi:hypothetical protein Pmani_018318 [Petrolisthes manimaculis]|uniref:Uncharacterized protein n=1 Tax=Petrolisthes manimaculis TaxID=1843537 RepID=A0AAE1PMP4_9EUCA|nr:hypothetical protein Pmani_018318 [Petrolisthes manimaculis]